MNNSFCKFLIIVTCFFALNPVFADELPDYYSEPGFSSTKSYETQGPVESIDPQSGNLRLHYTDLVVPGNGGLDIVVQRYYRQSSSLGLSSSYTDDYLRGKTVLGEGWDMHFGRIWKMPHSNGVPYCPNRKLASGTNPVLELSDGTRRELLDADNDKDYRFISKDLWVAYCESSTVIAVSPEGLRYTFSNFHRYGTDPALHVTRIEDKYGNYLTIDYVKETDQALIAEVNGSDGRKVSFKYKNITGLNAVPFNALLYEITVNGLVG